MRKGERKENKGKQEGPLINRQRQDQRTNTAGGGWGVISLSGKHLVSNGKYSVAGCGVEGLESSGVLKERLQATWSTLVLGGCSCSHSLLFPLPYLQDSCLVLKYSS